MAPGKKQIILIEDNDADARVIEDALTTSDLNCEVIRFRDGVHALSVLVNGDGASAVPDVILLDLYLAGTNGEDILEKILATPRLTSIPVAILTGSLASADKLRASANGATGYLLKPISYIDYVTKVRQLVEDLLK